jgi:hypothetical protein
VGVEVEVGASYEISESSSYVFTMTPNSLLLQAAIFYITIPDTMTLPSTDADCVVSQGSCVLDGDAMKITNYLTGDEDGSAPFSIEISGIINPYYTATPTGDFEIQVYVELDSTEYITHEGAAPITMGGNDFTSGTLSSVSVESSSDVNLVDSTYTFEFTNEHLILQNSVIEVIFPDQIIPTDDCVTPGAGDELDPFICTVVGQTLTITEAFDSGDKVADTAFSFQVDGNS